jgi:hypothetical protein
VTPGHGPHTTIYRSYSQIYVPIGITGHITIPTIQLKFDLPRSIFNIHDDPFGCIHIPLAMCSDGDPTSISLFPGDPRDTDLQIGDPEVRSAIYYHLITRSRACEKKIVPSTTSPLFGQVLLRHFVSARLLFSMRNELLSSYACRLPL